MKKNKLLKKFELERAVAEGHVGGNFQGTINLDNLNLRDVKENYLIHLKYSPENKKYTFSVYKEKE